MIRVLVVEDSAVARELLVALLGEDPALEVVGAARDGLEAVEQAARLRPDVVVMDVHMPRLDGYEATRRIMERTPVPIVMTSASFRQEEVRITFDALEAGALTVVEKPFGPDHPAHEETARRLLETVKLMSEVKVVRRWPRGERGAAAPPAALISVERRVRIVAIGASTGGPAAVAAILRGLPAELGAPLLLVQHIALGFTAGLAEWLGQQTALAVKVAEPREPTRAGTVYVAPEAHQMGITREGRILLSREPGADGFHPSASHLFRSVAEAYGRSALGILLTGMGRDGGEGLLALREAGGITVAQDEETSVVFGMPQEAIRLGAAEHVLSPDQIRDAVRSLAALDRQG